MKTIVAGCRDFTDYELLVGVIESCLWDIAFIISGKARGADSLGERYAIENNIPVLEFPANWNLHGRAAGHIRNKEMSDNADALIALWDGQSKGTKNMIDTARKAGHKIMIYNYVTGKLLYK